MYTYTLTLSLRVCTNSTNSFEDTVYCQLSCICADVSLNNDLLSHCACVCDIQCTYIIVHAYIFMQQESQLVEEIKQERSTLKNERDQLKKKLDSINSVQVTSDRSHAASNDGMTEPHHDVNVDVSVNEERLKWQMEMENLRKGFETEMDTMKKSSAIEKAELRKSISVLEKKCSTFDESSRQQISVLEKKLSESMERLE